MGLLTASSEVSPTRVVLLYNHDVRDVDCWDSENSFYSVFINNQYSHSLLAISGVLQSSVLGPLLFPIYINDLPLHVSCHRRMFADDSVIYRSVTNVSHQGTLQRYLNNTQWWCNRWLMCLNFHKCKAMSFEHFRNPLFFPYALANVSIELNETYGWLRH